jgi:hypothetical protein
MRKWLLLYGKTSELKLILERVLSTLIRSGYGITVGSVQDYPIYIYTR